MEALRQELLTLKEELQDEREAREQDRKVNAQVMVELRELIKSLAESPRRKVENAEVQELGQKILPDSPPIITFPQISTSRSSFRRSHRGFRSSFRPFYSYPRFSGKRFHHKARRGHSPIRRVYPARVIR